jgi:hypothetical protein
VGLYPFLRDEAAMQGYALAVHGSMARDFDLIAVPWVDNPAKPEDLVKELCDIVGGKVRLYKNEGEGKITAEPTIKPHGRLAWTIHLGGGPYIDLSVIPPKTMSPFFFWEGKRYEAKQDGNTILIACPICGDGIPCNGAPRDEMTVSHYQISIAPTGALTLTPSVVCPRNCGWHVVISNGVAE